MKIKSFLIVALFVPLTFISCKKEKEDEPEDKDKQTSEFQSTDDNNRHQREFDDVLSISFQAINQELEVSSSARLSADLCATVDLDVDNKEITIDFGDAGCLYNGITRKGKVILGYTGHYQDSGSVITATLENYRVQNTYLSTAFVAIEGTQTVTNKGVLAAGLTWEVKVENAKITFEDGDVSTWSSTRTRILVDEGTAAPFDEVYHIYGTAAGVNRDGLAYTAEILSANPVVFDFPCWVEKRMLIGGEIIVRPEGMLVRSVDYGYEKVPGEACDRSVTITYGGFSFNLDL